MEQSRTTPGTFSVARAMLEGALRRWYQSQVCSQEHSTRGMVLEPIEEVIIHTDLRWTQSMPSRFMAARVGQFLTGHFLSGAYLHRFGHLPSPLCQDCGVLDTRDHILLECPHWTYYRERLQEWLQSVRDSVTEEEGISPS